MNNNSYVMANTNIIGDNGERYAAIRLTQGQLFDVIQLGGKVPTYDLICQINDANRPYQFLVQVKATETAPIYTTKRPVRIKTPVPKNKYSNLQKLQLPTYVAGVDNTTGDVYISGAFEPNNKYGGSIPTTYHLTSTNLQQSLIYLNRLKQDVLDYWDGLDINIYKPAYRSGMV